MGVKNFQFKHTFALFTAILSFQETFFTSVTSFVLSSMITTPPTITVITLEKAFSRKIGVFASGCTTFNTCHFNLLLKTVLKSKMARHDVSHHRQLSHQTSRLHTT